MSNLPADDPKPGDAQSCDAIEQVIVPRARDLGGFEVRRALPAAAKQMVGPFIFFDQMGPAEFLIGTGIDVRPHPHIGLATVTYLFDGEIMHRDSLGTARAIKPGELNLMTAGRGIVHSERETERARKGHTRRCSASRPGRRCRKSHEEAAPAFAPSRRRRAAAHRRRGQARAPRHGRRSTAQTLARRFPASELLCRGGAGAGRRAAARSRLRRARGLYRLGRDRHRRRQRSSAGRLLVFRPGDRISILALSQARLMLLGGEPMDGPRHIWWNFVSSSKDRIDAAKADWKAGRFGLVPGDDEGVHPAAGMIGREAQPAGPVSTGVSRPGWPHSLHEPS